MSDQRAELERSTLDITKTYQLQGSDLALLHLAAAAFVATVVHDFECFAESVAQIDVHGGVKAVHDTLKRVFDVSLAGSTEVGA